MSTPLKVLIVEDSESDARLMVRQLERAGYAPVWERVETAEAMRTALGEQAWDLILADYFLPQSSAEQALAILHASGQDLPFIVVSGTIGEDVAVAMMKAGAHDYLLKNNLARLAPAVERELREAESRRQHRRAEDALRESEAKFRALTEESLVGVCAIQDGRFQYVNAALAHILGYTSEEPLALPAVAETVAEEDRALVAENIHRQVVGETKVLRYEFTAVRKNGDRRRMEMLGTATTLAGRPAVLGTALDITERKQAEEQIRELAAMLDQAHDAVLVRDLAGRIRYINQGAVRLFGWSKEEAAGANVVELYRDQGQFAAATQVLLATGKWAGELTLPTKSGRELIVASRWTLIRDAQGQSHSVLVINTDITEKKTLEAQFLRTQRLEAIGTLAGGIAHDLNNILSPILMGTSLLREAQPPGELAQTLDLIESNAQRAVGVVRQLLTFSRGQGGERIPLHLRHLLRDLHSIISATFPKNITFTTSLAPDLWTLVADPTQVHQVILNLCVNARDAMPTGGTLTLTAANFQVDENYASMAAGARPGPYVHLQVSDIGCGIRPEHLDKIFDPFFTTKEVGRGTGLGLPTVQKVVTGHGGFVTVRSRVGQGTTFDVYLPASPEGVVSGEPAQPAAALVGQGELILVVDDEESVRRIMQKTLLRHGYRVVTAGDGTEAVVVFANCQEEIKLVITDLMMPVMDGLRLAHVLVQMKPDVPIVVSTGLGDDPDHSQKLATLRRLGVRVILTKPYTADQLIQALQGVLA
jgi:PAS domain S-box-containing protein